MTGSRATRRGSLLIALVVIVTGLGMWFTGPEPLRRAELGVYNQQFLMRGSRPGHPQVAIVAIDEASLQQIGRWPWPRRVLGDLVDKLSAAGVAAIAFDVIFNEPEQSGEVLVANRLAERLRGQRVDASVMREIDALRREVDSDRRFAEAIAASGRVILPSMFPTLDLTPPAIAPERQGQPFKSMIIAFKNLDFQPIARPPHAPAVGLPIAPLLGAATSLGHVNMQADFDGTTRWEMLVIEHRGYHYPSLALETVRVAADVPPTALKLDFGTAVALGDLEIPVDLRARVLIDYAGPGKSFVHHSAADVLGGRVPADQLKDRVVFVGATAEGTYDLRVTPFSPILPGVEKHANVAANILEGRFIIQPTWVDLFEAALIIVLPIVLATILPRLRPLVSFAAALALWLLLAAGAHYAFRQGVWVPVVNASVAIGLTFVGVTVFRFFTEERQRQFTKRAFQQYVSPEVVERIVEDPTSLQFGGEIRNLTIMFCDIRDFTTFAERHDPHEVVAMLREHLTQLTNCVLEEKGTLDKYIGDAIMAIFGAPVTMPDHAERACRAALKMVEASHRLHEKWKAEGKAILRIGVGLNTGDMVVGNLGSEQVFNYTVTGDAVNLASRVESLNKDYATEKPILVTEFTYEAARNALDARPLGEVKVKGKTQPVIIYELLGMKNTTTE